ncbi:MAG: histidine phosphatase family protein [Chloroflexota bacterium]
MHLYLIRHGESWVNMPDDHQNHPLDAGLTERGQEQAKSLASWLKKEVPQIDKMYASSMRRAQETAVILATAYNCNVISDHRLREIGNNRLDHSPLSNDELPRQYTHLSPFENPITPIATDVENGETFMHFRIRIGLFIDELIQKHQEKTILAVCHGGVINAAVDHIFNIGPYRRCDVRGQHTSATYFQHLGKLTREPWRLHYLGQTNHLKSNLKK